MNWNDQVEAVIDKLTDASQFDFCDRIFKRLSMKRLKESMVPTIYFFFDEDVLMSLESEDVLL